MTQSTSTIGSSLQSIIETGFSEPNAIQKNALTEAVQFVFSQLESGDLRVCEKQHNTWRTQEWIKKAILLQFKLQPSKLISHTPNSYFDKISLQFENYTQSDFEEKKVRVVPPTHVRAGAYIAPNTVLMPSYINVGAYIDTHTMIDSWATIGSCAQIGKYVHISAGAVIAGVLEPIQADPVIIEDHCFIGANASISEGMIVKTGAVIATGVPLSQSTKIYHRETKAITYGCIPEGAVVVPGSLPAEDGSHNIACAIIVKQVDQKTRNKIGINQLLRS